MEAGASSGTGSFPAEDGEIWVPVLSDPLDGGSNSPTQAEIEVYSAYLDYDAMDFQAVLEGPQDEHDIEKLFGGAMFTSCGARSATYIKEANLTHEIECEFYSPTSDHGMIQTLAPASPETKEIRGRRRSAPATALPEKEEAPVTMALGGGGEEDKKRKGGGKGHPLPCQRRSMRLALAATPLEEGACATFIVDLLDYMPKSGWRHRSHLRSARKRGIWSLNTEQTFLLPNHLGNATCFQDMSSICKGKKCEHRKNNDHWTYEEMKKLVDALYISGVGNWTKLKHENFSTSVRTAMNLKDKWRNLKKAYTGNAKKRILPTLDKDCVEKIQKLASKMKLHL
uniref:Myb-like domain-containing protein n=2 Tax=Triticum urartu TaxID=4572 RepID=A0A8R7JYK7_TRIUA